MARLIDADALVENIKSEIDKENKVPLDDDRKYFYCAGMRNVIRLVKPLPTIDTIKHGQMINIIGAFVTLMGAFAFGWIGNLPMTIAMLAGVIYFKE